MACVYSPQRLFVYLYCVCIGSETKKNNIVIIIIITITIIIINNIIVCRLLGPPSAYESNPCSCVPRITE